MMGLAIVVAINRLLTQGSDAVAGLYTSVAFLSGGWPPLVVIALAIIVIGNRNARYSPASLLPPAITAILWSIWTIRAADSQVWTSAPVATASQRPDWGRAWPSSLWDCHGVRSRLIAFSRSLRERWTSSGKQWLTGWCQVMFACIVAGTVVPGLSQAARVPALVGLSIVVAACLDSVWMDNLSRPAPSTFFVVFSTIVGALAHHHVRPMLPVESGNAVLPVTGRRDVGGRSRRRWFDLVDARIANRAAA